MSKRRDLRGKTVVITGAAGVIGRALALRCAQRGAKLALLDIDRERLSELEPELAQTGAEVMAAACDITDYEACASTAAAIIERFGGIDALIHNAGITHLGLFKQTDVAVIRKVMDVNFFGAVNLTRACLDSLLARGGAIVALSSVAGFAPVGGRIGYAASKHALHGFFESLRAEVSAHGVQVMMVCPTFVAGPGIGDRALSADGGKFSGHRSETGDPVTPEEVAARIVDGIERGSRMLLIGKTGRLAFWLSHLLPATYEKIMTRRLVTGVYEQK